VAAEYQRSRFQNLETRGYPQLYDMQAIEPENYSVAARYPDVLADMQARLRRAREQFAPLKAKEIPEAIRLLRQGG
jgi:hypothetical protein